MEQCQYRINYIMRTERMRYRDIEKLLTEKVRWEMSFKSLKTKYDIMNNEQDYNNWYILSLL